MGFDVARVRGLYPGLGDGWIHFDAQAGMHVPESVAATVAVAMRTPSSAPGAGYPSSQRGSVIIDAARAALADVVGAVPAGVVLGASRSALLAGLAEACASRLSLGTEVVVSRLDEHANIAPWQRVARRSGAGVRWAEIDIETCELPEWQYSDLIGDVTRLVAVTAGSGSVGARPDVRAIADRAHAVGALVVVDASAAAAYGPLDITELGADVLVLSCSAWGGPPLAALVFRDPALLDALPSVAADPGVRGAARLELGRHQLPLLAGAVASVEHLATLAQPAGEATAPPSRRARLVASMTAVADYQQRLRTRLADGLRALPEVMVLGHDANVLPALSFTMPAVAAAVVVQRLADNGMCALPSGPEHGVFEALGVAEVGGAVQLGLGHYTTRREVDQLVRVVASLA